MEELQPIPGSPPARPTAPAGGYGPPRLRGGAIAGVFLAAAVAACATAPPADKPRSQGLPKDAAPPATAPAAATAGADTAAPGQRHDRNGLARLLPATSATATTDAAWTLIAAGDVMLAGSATPELAKMGYGAPFTAFAADFHGADLVYANLEAPVAAGGAPVAGKAYTFRQPLAVTKAIAAAGFDVLHLANNHMLDYGPEALAETLAALPRAGLMGCGAGPDAAAARRPATVVTAAGVRFAFVCYSNTFPEEYWAGPGRPGTAFGHARWVAADVAAAAATADVVVAGFHWGAELMRTPKDYQVALAETALAAGAAVVLGHHPHVLQPTTRSAAGVVAYSLGNFVFGSYSHRVSESALLRIRGRGARVIAVAALPLNVYNPDVNMVPRRLPRAAARRVASVLFGGPVEPLPGGWWAPAVTGTAERPPSTPESNASKGSSP